jgi:transposase
MRHAVPIDLSTAARVELEQRLSAPGRTGQRALIVLLAADGLPNRRIATIIGLNENQVGMWRNRYAALGLAGLRDLRRPGRPRKKTAA